LQISKNLLPKPNVFIYSKHRELKLQKQRVHGRAPAFSDLASLVCASNHVLQQSNCPHRDKSTVAGNSLKKIPLTTVLIIMPATSSHVGYCVEITQNLVGGMYAQRIIKRICVSLISSDLTFNVSALLSFSIP